MIIQRQEYQVPQPTIIEGRRVGNTTRVVDFIIQKLFTSQSVCIEFNSEAERKHTVSVVEKRLHSEHQGVFNDYNFVVRKQTYQNEYKFQLVYKLKLED